VWVRFSRIVFESLYVMYVAVSVYSISKSFTMCCLLETSKCSSNGLKCELFSKLCAITSFNSVMSCFVFRVFWWFLLFGAVCWSFFGRLFGIVFGLCCFGVLLGLL